MGRFPGICELCTQLLRKGFGFSRIIFWVRGSTILNGEPNRSSLPLERLCLRQCSVVHLVTRSPFLVTSLETNPSLSRLFSLDRQRPFPIRIGRILPAKRRRHSNFEFHAEVCSLTRNHNYFKGCCFASSA